MNKVIAIAQISVEKRDIVNNINKHIKFIKIAAEYKSNYIIFPELSLTGYELDFAKENAFDVFDTRLKPLIDICITYNITAIVGAPIKLKKGVVIGEFIIQSTGKVLIYSKKYLHEGESDLFIPGNLNPIIIDDSEVISFAICADTNNPIHSQNAYENNTSIYIASVLFSKSGYNSDAQKLKKIGMKYEMNVFLVNYSGKTGNYESAGLSGAWDSKGNLIGEIPDNNEGLLIVQKNDSFEWKSMRI